jgi:uncharacterized protein (DUF983 family)
VFCPACGEPAMYLDFDHNSERAHCEACGKSVDLDSYEIFESEGYKKRGSNEPQ